MLPAPWSKVPQTQMMQVRVLRTLAVFRVYVLRILPVLAVFRGTADTFGLAVRVLRGSLLLWILCKYRQSQQ